MVGAFNDGISEKLGNDAEGLGKDPVAAKENGKKESDGFGCGKCILV